MRRHHTKDKGDLAVVKAAAWFMENGFLVLQPMTEHAPFDLVVNRDHLFWRVQVKYRTMVNGAVTIRFENIRCDRRGNHIVPINRADVDLYCIYEPTSQAFCFVSPRDHAGRVHVRVWFDEKYKMFGRKAKHASQICHVLDSWAANFCGAPDRIPTDDIPITNRVL